MSNQAGHARSCDQTHELKGAPIPWHIWSAATLPFRMWDSSRRLRILQARLPLLEEERRRNLFAVVGAFTLHWAHLESLVDDINVALFEAGMAGRLPLHFLQKLEYQIVRVKNPPDWLTAMQGEWTRIQSDLTELASQRNHLVHGVVRNLNTDEIDLILTRRVPNGSGMMHSEVSFSSEDFHRMAIRSVEISHRVESYRDALRAAVAVSP